MEARARCCVDDAPATRSFAGGFSAITKFTISSWLGSREPSIRYLSSYGCLFSTIIARNVWVVWLAVELIERVTIEKPKLYISPPKARERICTSDATFRARSKSRYIANISLIYKRKTTQLFSKMCIYNFYYRVSFNCESTDFINFSIMRIPISLILILHYNINCI